MQVVYVIENETDVTGAWTTPEKAIRAYYHDYIDDNDMISGDALYGKPVSVEDMVESMSAPCSDYPILRRVPLDGTKAGYGGDSWYRDC